MHPGYALLDADADLSNIVTHGMYATYVILLFRPYIIEFGGTRRFVPDALQRCMEAAGMIVDQCRYLVKHHSVYRAPLSWQQYVNGLTGLTGSTTYVCGTTLVLQISGLPSITPQAVTFAQESLAFLQQILIDFSDVWPAAAQTAESLRRLQQDCIPTESDTFAVPADSESDEVDIFAFTEFA